MLGGADGAAGCGGQRHGVGGREVGEWVGLEVGPEVLDGVELGGVGREEGDPARLSVLRNWPLERRPVHLETVPDQDERCRAEFPGEEVEEGTDPWCVDIGVAVEAEVAHDGRALRWDDQGRDGGDLLVGATALVEDGRGPAGCPTATHQWRQEEARLIDEDQSGLQP